MCAPVAVCESLQAPAFSLNSQYAVVRTLTSFMYQLKLVAGLDLSDVQLAKT